MTCPIFAYWDDGVGQVEAGFDREWRAVFPQLKVYSREDVAPVLARHLPSRVELFQDVRFPAARSDLCRYLMLYEHGGLYTDCAFGIDVPDGLVSLVGQLGACGMMLVENKLFRDRRPAEHLLLINGFLYAEPRHPLMLDCLRLAFDNLARLRDREASSQRQPYDIWRLTGPWVLNVCAFRNVANGAPDPRHSGWDRADFPVLDPRHADRTMMIREEDLPVGRAVHRA